MRLVFRAIVNQKGPAETDFRDSYWRVLERYRLTDREEIAVGCCSRIGWGGLGSVSIVQ